MWTKLESLRPHHTLPPTNQAGVAGASDTGGYGEGLSPVLPAAPRKLLLPNTSQHAGEDTQSPGVLSVQNAALSLNDGWTPFPLVGS